MEQLTLEVAKRKVSGKKVRFLRRQGQTPASLYGPGIESLSIQADTRKMEQVLVKAGGTDLISLAVAGANPVKVLVREVQKEPLTDQLLHVDFYQVDLTQKITAEVPIHFFGEAPALKLGNVSVLHQVDMLEVEALPENLPHRIEIDLSVLTEIDQAIHVKDINLGSDVSIISDPESVITRAVETRVEVEVAEAPAAEVAAEVLETAEGEKAETAESEKAK